MTEETKYRLLWQIGNVISAFLYFSGTSLAYAFIRKVVFRKYRTIVLTYHRIRDDKKTPDISVTIEQFDKQLIYLREHFDFIPLSEAVKSLQNRHVQKNDCVSISFDDGYKDNYLNGFAVLKRHGVPAAIFLVSGQVGKSDDMLNIQEIESMKSHQIDFGSHTVDHLILSDLDADAMSEQVHRSKQDLEKILQSEIQLFAYPKGKRNHYNKAAKREVRKAGYFAAFTNQNGPLQKSDDIYELKRMGIRNCPLFVFKVRVSGLYESKPLLYVRKLMNLT